MDMSIKKRDFTRTKQALAEFDAGRGERDHLWNTAECNADVEKADQRDRADADKVREAFHLDTLDINSRENCMRIHVGDIRRVVA